MIRRWRVLTHRKVQFRLASVFLFWVVAFLAISACIYFLHFASAASRAEQLPLHDELLTKMLLVDQARELILLYGAAVILFLALIWIYLMVYAHRLTGPIYKLEKMLEHSIHNRQLPGPLKFRKSDAFHELAEKFNAFVETFASQNSQSQSDTSKKNDN